MSYLTQSKMARDYGLIMRIAACANSEGVTSKPEAWADERRIRFAASPGWADAYAASQRARDEWTPESGGPQPPEPGEDETAITDDSMRAAVRRILAEDAAQAQADKEQEAERLRIADELDEQGGANVV